MAAKVYYCPSSPSGLRWVKNNEVAGSLNTSGYYRVGVEGKSYRAHRVIAHLELGFDLSSELVVDHIDRCKTNNKVENLRIVTQKENNKNKAPRKARKCPKTGKWRAVGRNDVWLGYYDTKEQAQEVVNEWYKNRPAVTAA